MPKKIPSKFAQGLSLIRKDAVRTMTCGIALIKGLAIAANNLDSPPQKIAIIAGLGLSVAVKAAMYTAGNCLYDIVPDSEAVMTCIGEVSIVSPIAFGLTVVTATVAWKCFQKFAHCFSPSTEVFSFSYRNL